MTWKGKDVRKLGDAEFTEAVRWFYATGQRLSMWERTLEAGLAVERARRLLMAEAERRLRNIVLRRDILLVASR